MKKFRIFLGALLMLCTLLNCTGCVYLRAKYNVFSDKEHTITQVSSTERDLIGIVLDTEELVLCNYKGQELCRKQFDKNITNLDIYSKSILLQFDDDTIELYYLENHNMVLKTQRSFSAEIKVSEIVRQKQDYLGHVVLLENGELYYFSGQSSSDKCIPIEEHAKTAVCLDDFFVYITEFGEVSMIWQGLPYNYEPDIDLGIACDIKELKLARFDGREGFLGIGTDQIYYLSGIAPLMVDTRTDLSNIDFNSVCSGKALKGSVIYQEKGKWYYEGIRRDYESEIFHKDRRIIKPKDGESMLPIQGGVIYYTDHNVRIQLI